MRSPPSTPSSACDSVLPLMDFTGPAHQIDRALDRFRPVGDELADAAALELLDSGRARSEKDWVAALQLLAQGGGQACARLLEHASTVPAWVCFPKMRAASQLALRTPVQSAVCLIFGSLLESYGFALGAKVLVRSGMLTNHVLRRLRDTTTFVMELAASRGPRPGTLAHRTILRTRLVHAFVRHGILRRGDWNFDWGHPVNQEDSASTLLVFSHVYLRSMARLGATPTAEEEASVHHLYRWVGYVLGVAPQLLTEDRAQEQSLYQHIVRRRLHPDDDSRLLAQCLIQALEGGRPLFLPAAALAALARHLLGDALGDALGLRRSPFWNRFTPALPWCCGAQREVERIPFARVTLERLGEPFARLFCEFGFSR